MTARLWSIAGAAAVLVLLVALPAFLREYIVALATKMLIFALFAMSLDLLLGYTGLASLGHAAYFGVAAYTVALLVLRAGVSSGLAFPAALVAAALTGALFAPLALRARGSYFLMITFALAQVVWSVAFGWRTLTNGDDGMPDVARPNFGFSLDSTASFYYFVLAVVGVAAVVARRHRQIAVRPRAARHSRERVAHAGARLRRVALSVCGVRAVRVVRRHRRRALRLLQPLRRPGISLRHPVGRGVDHGDPGRRRHADRSGDRRRD